MAGDDGACDESAALFKHKKAARDFIKRWLQSSQRLVQVGHVSTAGVWLPSVSDDVAAVLVGTQVGIRLCVSGLLKANAWCGR